MLSFENDKHEIFIAKWFEFINSISLKSSTRYSRNKKKLVSRRNTYKYRKCNIFLVFHTHFHLSQFNVFIKRTFISRWRFNKNNWQFYCCICKCWRFSPLLYFLKVNKRLLIYLQILFLVKRLVILDLNKGYCIEVEGW